MLSGAEIAALLTEDRKIAFERFSYVGTARLGADETFAVLIPRLGQDTGVWWLEDDRICSRWARFRQGRVLCAKVGQLADGTYRGLFAGSGAVIGDFRFVN